MTIKSERKSLREGRFLGLRGADWVIVLSPLISLAVWAGVHMTLLIVGVGVWVSLGVSTLAGLFFMPFIGRTVEVLRGERPFRKANAPKALTGSIHYEDWK